MSTLEQQLKQAEELVAAVRKQLESSKEAEVLPVFPGKGLLLYCDGSVSDRAYGATKEKIQGSTFYTRAEAEKESLRRQAEVRVREAIHKANGGPVTGTNSNLFFVITYRRNASEDPPVFTVCVISTYTTEGKSWELLKDFTTGEDLLRDPSFVKDWVTMKGHLV